MPAADPDSVDFSVAERHKHRQSRLLALAGRQDDAVSLRQLTLLGFTRAEVRARVRRGDWTPVHRGVYLVGRGTLSPRGHLHAALLAAPGGAFLSHRSAAAAYGLRQINRFEIHITVPAARSRQRNGNLIRHRATNLHRDDVRTYNRLRVSSIPQMLIELTSTETERELDRLVTEAARRDLLHVDKLTQALRRNSRRPGLVKLRGVLGDYVWKPRDKSTLERDFAAFIVADPLIPEPVRNEYIGPYEIDVHWPEHRLAVELDGRHYHQAVKDPERDNAKDIYLQKRGIRSVRIRDYRFEHDRAGIRGDLLDFLRSAADAA